MKELFPVISIHSVASVDAGTWLVTKSITLSELAIHADGRVTGRMLTPAFAGSIALFLATLIVQVPALAGTSLTIISVALCLAWLSWLVLPALWCGNGHYYEEGPYLQFVAKPVAIGALALPLLSIALRRLSKSK